MIFKEKYMMCCFFILTLMLLYLEDENHYKLRVQCSILDFIVLSFIIQTTNYEVQKLDWGDKTYVGENFVIV